MNRCAVCSPPGTITGLKPGRKLHESAFADSSAGFAPARKRAADGDSTERAAAEA